MRAGGLSRQITVEMKQISIDPTYGTELITWVPLVADAGSPTVAVRFWAEVQDVLPSRDERLTQGVSIATNRTRIRMRWRNDIDSSARITVHGDTNVLYQIVGGPVEIEGRKERIEMLLERYSS